VHRHGRLTSVRAQEGRHREVGATQALLPGCDVIGFMRYYRSDICALMAGSPTLWKATQYSIGNHTVAELAVREDAAAAPHHTPP